MRRFWLEHAWLPEGWAPAIGLDIAPDGTILRVMRDAGTEGRETVSGCVLPGLPNLHSHGFQRAMAALTQRKRATEEDFWSWRGIMYRTALALSPEDVAAVTAMAYAEMLEAGFTTVGEFHYLHHDVTGSPYADPAELAARIAEAASVSGIGLTLLPVLYSSAGIGRPALPEQRRFVTDRDAYLRLHDASRAMLAKVLPGAVIGAAPHSLRAARPEDVAAIAALIPDGPLHIHAAEQTAEIVEVEAALGCRPVDWLLDEAGIDPRWCLIHATHMTRAETLRLAASGAVAGLCPFTESDLGDGIFDGAAFVSSGGLYGVGSDSNVAIDAFGELRHLEWSQCLRERQRLVLADPGRDSGSTGAALYRAALAGGAQALGQRIGAIAEGFRADLVSLRREDTDLAALPPESWLDHAIFTGRNLIDRVYAAGTCVVRDGRHKSRDAIRMRFAETLRRIAE